MSGKLITIDGLDASGKHTNIELLEKALKDMGIDVVTFSFPEYKTETGKVISKYLRGEFGDINSVPPELICTAYAADRAKCMNEIRFYLENNYYVLCDRYTYSNIFSIAKLPEYKWDDFMNWIEKLEFDCMGIIKPNLNIYLHVNPEISFERIKERGKREYQKENEDIHESNFNLLKNADKAYMYFANKKDNWVIIDEMENNKQMPIERVFAKLFEVIYNDYYND